MKSPYLFLFLFIFISCSNDDNTNESNEPVLTASDFSPNTQGDYWKYNVNSSSEDLPDMDFNSIDSLYVATTSSTSYTLDANNGIGADGSMNSILTSGTLSTTNTVLSYNGALDLPIDLDIDQSLEITDLVLLDLNAENGAILSSIDGMFSEDINIQGTVIPISVNYELFTAKENFYDTKVVNGTSYSNVYEGSLGLNLSVTGTITFFDIDILESQDILLINYYYGANIGLLRAESDQGFELAPQIIALIEQTGGGGGELPFSANVSGIEELSNYLIN
jgi:hypothetical protein